jgi:hypothetical protein
MAKSNPPKDPELHPDAWERFKRAVHIVAKSPPQHRTKKTKTKAKRPAKKKTK